MAPHGDLLEHGAIGLADDDALISPQLLEQGLVLGEMGSCPVLVAPRDPGLQGAGMVREGVETLRAGWPPDPMSSEILPISQLLALHQRHPDRQLRLMNLSTAAAVEQLVAFGDHPPLSSVNWWHLLADRNGLAADDPGWRVRPSLGGGKTENGSLMPCSVKPSQRFQFMRCRSMTRTCCCPQISDLQGSAAITWFSPLFGMPSFGNGTRQWNNSGRP